MPGGTAANFPPNRPAAGDAGILPAASSGIASGAQERSRLSCRRSSAIAAPPHVRRKTRWPDCARRRRSAAVGSSSMSGSPPTANRFCFTTTGCERTTDGRGRVSALSLAAVRRHDAGDWFRSSFAGERVPTLEEALMLLAELGLGANVELKAARGEKRRRERWWLSCSLGLGPPIRAHLLISSFQRAALAAARDRAPHIARGILFRAHSKELARRCRAAWAARRSMQTSSGFARPWYPRSAGRAIRCWPIPLTIRSGRRYCSTSG